MESLVEPVAQTALCIAEVDTGHADLGESELMRPPPQLLDEPLPVDDPMQRKPDITFARQALGWEPKVRLRDGLVETIAYFDRLRSGMGSRG